MGITKITLGSGNIFYHFPESDDAAEFAVVTDSKKKIFLGGFMCKEANRKLVAFSKHGSVEENTQDLLSISGLDTQAFASKLGSAEKIFIKMFTTLVSDRENFDGTSSDAQSCDSRLDYYKVVGIESIYGTRKRFAVGIMIANHFAIFGANNFRHTFFRNNDNVEKDSNVDLKNYMKYSWSSNDTFKAPAPYLRALARSFGVQ